MEVGLAEASMLVAIQDADAGIDTARICWLMKQERQMIESDNLPEWYLILTTFVVSHHEKDTGRKLT